MLDNQQLMRILDDQKKKLNRITGKPFSEESYKDLIKLVETHDLVLRELLKR